MNWVLRAFLWSAITGSGLAVFMTVSICGMEGFSRDNFTKIKTCGVTDPPQEVFLSFFLIGAAIAALLYVFYSLAKLGSQ